MAISYNEIPSEILGLTNAEIAAHMSAMTTGPIKVDKLRDYLNRQGLMKPKVDGGWRGRLVDALDPSVALQTKQVLSEGIDHIAIPSTLTIASHTTEWALPIALMLAELQVVTLADGQPVITATQAAGFYGNDGGLRYPSGVTAEQVAAAKSAKAAQDVLDAKRAAVNAAITSSGITETCSGTLAIIAIHDLPGFKAAFADIAAAVEAL